MLALRVDLCEPGVEVQVGVGQVPAARVRTPCAHRAALMAQAWASEHDAGKATCSEDTAECSTDAGPIDCYSGWCQRR